MIATTNNFWLSPQGQWNFYMIYYGDATTNQGPSLPLRATLSWLLNFLQERV